MSETKEASSERQGEHLIHGDAEESIMGRFAVFKDTGPEEDESWEDWYHAALDLLGEECRSIARCFSTNVEAASPVAWQVLWDEKPEGMFARTEAESQKLMSNIRTYAKGAFTNLRARPLYPHAATTGQVAEAVWDTLIDAIESQP